MSILKSSKIIARKNSALQQNIQAKSNIKRYSSLIALMLGLGVSLTACQDEPVPKTQSNNSTAQTKLGSQTERTAIISRCP